MPLELAAQLALSCRRLFLRDYVVQAHIGAHAFEKTRTQRLVLNVELFVLFTHSSSHRDQLQDVVDYDFVREVIAQRVRAGHIVLQETLCDDLVTRLLAQPGVQAVRLSSCKPDAYPDCAGVGVEVFRMKGAAL